MICLTFVEALESENIENIRKFPKSDLHNHFVLGGSREYILCNTGHEIKPINEPLSSMSEMDAWSGRYIGDHFNSPAGRRLLIEAAFAQAKEDGVAVFEIGTGSHPKLNCACRSVCQGTVLLIIWRIV